MSNHLFIFFINLFYNLNQFVQESFSIKRVLTKKNISIPIHVICHKNALNISLNTYLPYYWSRWLKKRNYNDNSYNKKKKREKNAYNKVNKLILKRTRPAFLTLIIHLCVYLYNKYVSTWPRLILRIVCEKFVVP